MTSILFLNPWEGLSFMLNRALTKEDIVVESKNIKDDSKLFKKHNVRTCPVLIIFDGKEEVERLNSVEEIVNYFKENNV